MAAPFRKSHQVEWRLFKNSTEAFFGDVVVGLAKTVTAALCSEVNSGGVTLANEKCLLLYEIKVNFS